MIKLILLNLINVACASIAASIGGIFLLKKNKQYTNNMTTNEETNTTENKDEK